MPSSVTTRYTVTYEYVPCTTSQRHIRMWDFERKEFVTAPMAAEEQQQQDDTGTAVVAIYKCRYCTERQADAFGSTISHRSYIESYELVHVGQAEHRCDHDRAPVRVQWEENAWAVAGCYYQQQ